MDANRQIRHGFERICGPRLALRYLATHHQLVMLHPPRPTLESPIATCPGDRPSTLSADSLKRVCHRPGCAGNGEAVWDSGKGQVVRKSASQRHLTRDWCPAWLAEARHRVHGEGLQQKRCRLGNSHGFLPEP